MTHDSAPRARLLDFRGALALVVANTIGTGVFTTSGFALADLGAPSYVMAAWLVGGLYALCGVAIYADLAARYPQSGGEYAFLRQTLHPALGTAAGWISLVAGFTSPIAAAALGAELYAARVGGFTPGGPWVASALIIALVVLHAGAPATGVRFQNIAVAIKISAILAFIGFGAAPLMKAVAAAPSASPAEPFSWIAFGGSLVWISYAYSGWNAAVYVTGEVEGAGATVRRALYAGAAAVIALYLGVSAVILYGAPLDELRGVADSGAVAARALGGATAESALSALIALALVTSASSMLFSGPRVYARMAQDGALPAILGRLHGDHPRIAILAQGALCLVVVWSASLRNLLEFVGVTLSLSAAMVVIGWLRQEFAAARRPRPLLVAAGALFLTEATAISFTALTMRPGSAIAALLLIAVGLVSHYARGLRAGATSTSDATSE